MENTSQTTCSVLRVCNQAKRGKCHCAHLCEHAKPHADCAFRDYIDIGKKYHGNTLPNMHLCAYNNCWQRCVTVKQNDRLDRTGTADKED